MPKTRVIVLDTGYAEMHVVPSTIYRAYRDFDTRLDALISLARTLFKKYEEDYLGTLRYCHKYKKYRNDKGEYVLCPNAGMEPVGKCPACKDDFDAHIHSFTHFMRELATADCDSFGGELDGPWWPFDGVLPLFQNKPEEIMVLWESGEDYLVRALAHIKNELPATFVADLEEMEANIKKYEEEYPRNKETLEEFLEKRCNVLTPPR